MSARRWPTAAPERVPGTEVPPAPLVVPEDASIEEAATAEKAARVNLDAARAEVEAARAEVSAARAALPDAAALGLTATQKAAAAIATAESRLQLAEDVYGAVERAYRPLHDRASVLRRRKLGESAVAALLGKLAERDAVDVELDAVFEKLTQVALSRIAVDREALVLAETARGYGVTNPGREVHAPMWSTLKAATRSLPDDVKNALRANL